MSFITAKQTYALIANLICFSHCSLQGMQAPPKWQEPFGIPPVDSLFFSLSAALPRADRTLITAAAEGNQNRLRDNLPTARLEATDNRGTALHWAAQNGHAAVVQDLIVAGAHVNATTLEEDLCPQHTRSSFVPGATPLFLAARNGHRNVVDVLMRAGANIHQAAADGRTPLYIAAQNGDHLIIRRLVQADPGIIAGGNYHLTPLQIIMPQIINPLQIITPLQIATLNRHAQAVRALVEAGVDVNATADITGLTPLHLAARDGTIPILRILLAHPEIRINQATGSGNTALEIALAIVFESNRRLVAQLLIHYGATATVTQIAQIEPADTLAHQAAVGNIDNVINLLQHQPSSDEIAIALLYATGQGHPEAVRHLIATGIDPRPALTLVTTILNRTTAPEPNTVHRYEDIRYELIRQLSVIVGEDPRDLLGLVNIILQGTLHDNERARYNGIHDILRNRFTLRNQIIRQPNLLTAIGLGRSRLVGGRLPDGLEESWTANRRLIYAAQTANEEELRQAFTIPDALGALADPNHSDIEGLTAAWRATHLDELTFQKILTILLSHGFDPDIPHPSGQTLIQLALRRQWFNVARLLLYYGAYIDYETIGHIPLTEIAQAAARGDNFTVEQLLPMQTDEAIEDALLYAAGQGHINTTLILARRLGSTLKLRAEFIITLILRRTALTEHERSDYELILMLLNEQPLEGQEVPQAAAQPSLLPAATPAQPRGTKRSAPGDQNS